MGATLASGGRERAARPQLAAAPVADEEAAAQTDPALPVSAFTDDPAASVPKPMPRPEHSR